MRPTKFAVKLCKRIFTQNVQRSYKRFSRCAVRTREMRSAHAHDTQRSGRAREMLKFGVQDTWLPSTRYAAYTHKVKINLLQICAAPLYMMSSEQSQEAHNAPKLRNAHGRFD